jgi:PBP1b-binding outer membrane lipoprotein LpoB
MKKLFLVIGLALALAGCTELKIAGQAISLAQKTAANPVTKDDLAKVELSADTLVKGLLAYKRACAANAVDKNCRSNVAAIQQYTIQVPPYIAQLRSFVKNDDQINATVAYNELMTLYTNVKATATNLGVNLGV